MSPKKKTKMNIIIDTTLLKLKAISEFKPTPDKHTLYNNQINYIVEHLSNTILLINKYTTKLKDTYKLNKILDYPIKITHSLEQHIINIQLIQLTYNYILNSEIEPIDIIKYVQILTLYFNKIATYINYPSNWVGAERAVWLLDKK